VRRSRGEFTVTALGNPSARRAVAGADPKILICDDREIRACACPGYGVGAVRDGRRGSDGSGARGRRAALCLGQDHPARDVPWLRDCFRKGAPVCYGDAARCPGLRAGRRLLPGQATDEVRGGGQPLAGPITKTEVSALSGEPRRASITAHPAVCCQLGVLAALGAALLVPGAIGSRGLRWPDWWG